MSSLSGNGYPARIVLGSAALVVDQTSDTTYSGNIEGTGSFTKQGSGTLTFSGDSYFPDTYTGGTTVRNGALIVDGGVMSQGAGNTIVGDLSGDNGTLIITNGAAVTNQQAYIGYNAGSSGLATVDGASSSWTVETNIYVGFSGTGTLNLVNGGLAHARALVLAVVNTAVSCAVNIGTGGGAGIVDAKAVVGVTSSNPTLNFNHTNTSYYFTTDGTSNGVPVVITGTMSVNQLGDGVTILTTNDDYTGLTTVAAGTLLVDGSLTSSSVLVSGGTLGGNGTFSRPVTVQSGGTLSPGHSIGQLTAFANVALAAGSTTVMEISPAAATNDQLRVFGTLFYGGTLTVSNLSGTLTAGESFDLFNAANHSGSFAETNLPPLDAGLAWNFNEASGVLRVVSTVATNLNLSVSSGNLNLSWPADHIGWQLQAQTNAPGSGLGTNWADISNSSLTNQMTFPLDSTNGSVFYRMIYQ